MQPRDTIGAGTRYCAVYGHPVRHSASPAMHNAGMRALGLDWRYLAFDLPPGDLKPALAGAAAMRFIGVNLTVPHKLMAVELMDELDESARTWGAVNTVRFEARDESGAWKPVAEVATREGQKVRAHGFNTDADALARAIEEELGLPLEGAKVMLAGAGGAGRAAALRLAAAKAECVWLVNRTASKEAAVQAEIEQRFPGARTVTGYPDTNVDLIINATSLGLKSGDPLPWDMEKYPLRRTAKVYDMVYRPAESGLIRAARREGCKAVNGLGMLLYQGAKALEIWSGRTAPVKVMRRALEDFIRSVE